MSTEDILEQVQAAHETQLSRLGSSKWVYALTEGEMTADSVLHAAAEEAAHAADAFDEWSASAEDGSAASLFGSVADDARRQYETVAPDGHEQGSPPPMYETLAAIEGTVARAGALLGRTLVTTKTLEQMVGFFVGDADPQTADTFRGLRDDVRDQRDAALELIDEVCVDEADREVVEAAAAEVIQSAYEDYVETLESMGIKPKNVC
jgi:hypothetical protein